MTNTVSILGFLNLFIGTFYLFDFLPECFFSFKDNSCTRNNSYARTQTQNNNLCYYGFPSEEPTYYTQRRGDCLSHYIFSTVLYFFYFISHIQII